MFSSQLVIIISQLQNGRLENIQCSSEDEGAIQHLIASCGWTLQFVTPSYYTYKLWITTTKIMRSQWCYWVPDKYLLYTWIIIFIDLFALYPYFCSIYFTDCSLLHVSEYIITHKLTALHWTVSRAKCGQKSLLTLLWRMSIWFGNCKYQIYLKTDIACWIFFILTTDHLLSYIVGKLFLCRAMEWLFR